MPVSGILYRQVPQILGRPEFFQVLITELCATQDSEITFDAVRRFSYLRSNVSS
jgi:hypothetical protein